MELLGVGVKSGGGVALHGGFGKKGYLEMGVIISNQWLCLLVK